MKNPRNIGIILLVLLNLLAAGNIYGQWQILSQLPGNEKLNYIYFLDNENAPNIGFAGGYALWKTTDRGKTWSQASITMKNNSIVTCMTFVDKNEGWLTTANTNVSKGNVYHSTDGGATWNLLTQLVDASYSAILYNKTFKRLFLTSRTENSSVSTDNGVSWTAFATPSHNGFAFLNDTVGFCSPWRATYLLTFDGGATWKPTGVYLEVWQPLTTTANHGFYALSENTGYLIRSLDSGQTWYLMGGSSPYTNTGQIGGTLPRLYFQSQNGDGFYMSIDSGLTWFSICGPTSIYDSRFYIQNDSIYVGVNNLIWFNPDPSNSLRSRIRFSVDPLETKECNKTSTPLQMSVFFECAAITVLSATISDSINFSLDTSVKFPIFPVQDMTVNNFISFHPSIPGNDWTYLHIVYMIRGIKRDTMLIIVGNAIKAPIQDTETPEYFNLGIDSVCKSYDTELSLTSLCHPFDLVSIELEDTTALSFIQLYQFPLNISSDKSLKLRLKFIPKMEVPVAFSTALRLTFRIGSFVMTKEIPVNCGGIVYNVNQFPEELYVGKSACEVLDTTWDLANPLCDSIRVSSLSFLDSSSLLFSLPQTPFTIPPDDMMSSNMSISSGTLGTFNNQLIVHYFFRNVEYTTLIPIRFFISKSSPTLQLSDAKVLFGNIDLCKPKSKMITISNSHCFDMTVESFDWIPSLPDISIAAVPKTPFTLKSGETDSLILIYAPTILGKFSTTLRIRIQYDGRLYDTLITVSGAASSSAVCSLNEPILGFDTVSTCMPMTKSAYLINDNCDSILVTELSTPKGADFIMIDPPLPIWVHSGDSVKIRITYSPTTNGETLDSITFLGQTVSGITEPQTLVLSGFGEKSDQLLSFIPKQFDFKTISFCSDSSNSGRILNTECESVTIDSVMIFGDADFLISTIDFKDRVIDPTNAINYSIGLHPKQKGLRNGYLVFISHDRVQSRSDTIPFSGTVTDGTRILSSSIAAADFGSISVCDERDTLVRLQNTGCDTLVVSGISGLGSGFGTDTKFPIMILPKKDTVMHVFTLLDTAGGKLLATSTLTFNSNSDITLAPIKLSRAFIQSTRHDVGLFLDGIAKVGGDHSTVTYDIKETPGKTFSGAGMQQVTFDLNYNTNLLDFTQSGSSNVTSADGKNFTISGSPIIADANGVLASIGFTVYLTKDSVTSINMTDRIDTTFSPCGLTTLSVGGSATFDYNFLCGERSISGFMNSVMPMRIVSLHPNPSQDEIELDLQSATKQNAQVEIFDALGVKVFSDSQNIIAGSNQVHLNTKSLSAGMYLVRIGGVSQSFVKMK